MIYLNPEMKQQDFHSFRCFCLEYEDSYMNKDLYMREGRKGLQLALMLALEVGFGCYVR